MHLKIKHNIYQIHFMKDAYLWINDVVNDRYKKI